MTAWRLHERGDRDLNRTTIDDIGRKCLTHRGVDTERKDSDSGSLSGRLHSKTDADGVPVWPT